MAQVADFMGTLGAKEASLASTTHGSPSRTTTQGMGIQYGTSCPPPTPSSLTSHHLEAASQNDGITYAKGAWYQAAGRPSSTPSSRQHAVYFSASVGQHLPERLPPVLIEVSGRDMQAWTNA